MVVAEIDKDYINTEPESEYNRVGKKFEITGWGRVEIFGVDNIPPKVRFRCKDDDGEVYYGGWLYNDSECEVQEEVLRWCQNDAGCTTIEIAVMQGDSTSYHWKQEIG